MLRKSKLIIGFTTITFVAVFAVVVYVRSDGGTRILSEDEALGAIPGPEITEKLHLRGGEPVTYPVVVATSTTGNSATLVANDLVSADYHIVKIDKSAGAAGSDFTYTTPASSTLKNFVNRIGASEQHCFFQSATTSDSQVIFAAGTGVDFKYASSTSASDGVPSLSISSEAELCIDFIRQPDDSNTRGLGDITAVLKNYAHGD